MYNYRLYGLTVMSNVALPHLPQSVSLGGEVNVRLWFDGMPSGLNLGDGSWREHPRFVSKRQSDQGDAPMLRVLTDGSYDRLCYLNEIDFVLSGDSRQMWIGWSGRFRLEDVVIYLLGPVMGFLLRRLGVVCLHASAIGVDDGCFLLTGRSGAGKSTTAAYFAQRGYAILTDDIAALRLDGDGVWVESAYPRLKLWTEAVIALYGSAEALSPMAEGWHKHYMELEGDGFVGRAMRIKGIYVLEGRERGEDAPRLRELGGGSGLVKLATHTYMNYLIDRKLRASEFSFLSEMVKRVRVSEVIAHSELARLPQLCDLLLTDHTSQGG